MEMREASWFLINSLPMGLIPKGGCDVNEIDTKILPSLKGELLKDPVSLWGHENTIKEAERVYGKKIPYNREAMSLAEEGDIAVTHYEIADENGEFFVNPEKEGYENRVKPLWKTRLNGGEWVGTNKLLVLTPVYQKGFRPTYMVEVTPDKIIEWRAFWVYQSIRRRIGRR